MSIKIQAEGLLKTLLRTRVTEARVTSSTGSIIYIFFADEDASNEYHLEIWCTWRLSESTQIITAWNESNKHDGPMQKGIRGLQSDWVEAIEVSDLGDIKIQFLSGQQLQIFCDNTPNYEMTLNWCLRINDDCYILSNQFEIKKEPYHS